jgi:hypothetical protein
MTSLHPKRGCNDWALFAAKRSIGALRLAALYNSIYNQARQSTRFG